MSEGWSVGVGEDIGEGVRGGRKRGCECGRE